MKRAGANTPAAEPQQADNTKHEASIFAANIATTASATTTTTSDGSGLHPDIGNNLPKEIRVIEQWVAWRYEPRPNSRKPAKKPVDPETGGPADVTKPETWGTFEEALHAVEEYGLDGVGFVFTERDAYAGVDLDDVLDDETGELEPWAARVIEKFASYTEISPSGNGVKIIARGELPDKGARRGRVELYGRSRFFALTGRVVSEHRTVEDAQGALERLYRKVKERTKVTPPAPATPAVSIADEEILAKARSAANRRKFIRLFHHGDTSGYASQSEADLALCGMLAFWTGRDPERMDRLFRRSALYREKWERDDYRESTIRRAIERCRSVYSPEPQEATPSVQRIFGELEELAAGLPWEGRGGPTDRCMYSVILDTGGGRGRETERGVNMSLACRDAGPSAGISARTAATSLRRLEERGLIADLVPGKGRRASRFTLLKASHIRTTTEQPPCEQYVKARGDALRKLRKLRNRAPEMPEFDRNGRRLPSSAGHPLQRLGKEAGVLCVERILCAGGLTLSELAASIRRRRDNVARLLPLLFDAGLLVEDDEGVLRTHPEWEANLDRELEDSGCNAAERRDRRRYAGDRAKYHELTASDEDRPPGPRPTMNVEEFLELADSMREAISRRRAEQPPRPRWGVDPEKEAFYFPERYRGGSRGPVSQLPNGYINTAASTVTSGDLSRFRGILSPSGASKDRGRGYTRWQTLPPWPRGEAAVNYIP